MLKMNSMRFFYSFLPAENKDGRAPFVEELESPVVDGGGVDLEEVLEYGEPGSGDTSQGGHPSSLPHLKPPPHSVSIYCSEP